MRFKLDENLPPEAAAFLRERGHEVFWAGDWSEDPGDAAIPARAFQEDRVLVTLDKDFGELGVLRDAPRGAQVARMGGRCEKPLSSTKHSQAFSLWAFFLTWGQRRCRQRWSIL